MSHSSDKDFTSAQVDEQIENHLSSSRSTPKEPAGQLAVQRLQKLYQVKSGEHVPSLERVWQRVLASEVQETPQTSVAENAHPVADEHEETQQEGVIGFAYSREKRRKRALLTQLVAVLCLVIVVGGFVLVNNLSHSAQPASLAIAKSANGLYGYQGSAVYRLDSQTHRILWKHTFASGENVQDGIAIGDGSEMVSVANNILYATTQDKQGRQYWYALDTTNGSVLWRELSARIFVNTLAAYTLVESKTSNISTLTARNPRTGQQLWQRQYPIAGAKIDPARGTDSTEGFRLITVTDQILYAVVWYRYNGQDIFTRYGLSPTNGSIIWQDREVISGRMPVVEAQIVDGVIYTLEYNLKPVTTYIDSHGMTVDEVPQSRAAAYDAATGHQRWQTPYMVGEEPNGGFYLTVSDDMLYFQTYNNEWPETARQPNSITTLHALSMSDGLLHWQYQKKDEGGMTGAVLAGDHLYFEISKAAMEEIEIVALSAQTGKVSWATPVKLLDGSEKTPTPVPNSVDPDFSSGYAIDMSPVASNDAVYYSTPGNRVYVLQPSDGKILSQFWVDKTAQTTVLDRITLLVVP